MKQIIPILYACDDNYLPLMGTSICSLMENADKSYEYMIYILYTPTDIDQKNIDKIMSMQNDTFKIIFVDVEEELEKIVKKLKTSDYYTNTTYYRLFVSKLFPQYDKIIYIDSDTVILGDISNLYNIDIGNNIIAGCTDESVVVTPVFREYVEKVVGVDSFEKYFNAGMIVINLKEFKEQKIFDRFLKLNDDYYFEVAQDQDLLNVLCKDKVHYLDLGWNKMPIKDENYKSLNIIHFNHGFKPWYFDGVLYEEYFWKYAKKSLFYNSILQLKNTFTEQDKVKTEQTAQALFELAQKEIDRPDNYKKKFSKGE